MSKVYSGMKVNFLTVIDDKRIHKDGDYRQGYYLCRCECGNVKEIKDHSIQTGKIRDCGCGEFIRRKHIGKQYGTMKVLDAFREVRCNKINIVLKCKCIVCGREKKILSSNLKKHNLKTCSHNKDSRPRAKQIKLKVPSRLRNCWKRMIARCYDETNLQFFYYGARGIRICDEWRNSLKSFCDWALNNGYEDNLTIERMDYNKNYCPENCKWIPKEEQSRNTRRNRIYEWKGKTLTVAEISRMENISQFTLYCRLNRGLSIEDAVSLSFTKKEI